MNNNGVEETIKQHYAADYKKSFDNEISLHNQLITEDSGTESNQDENIKDEAIDLVGNNNVDLQTRDNLSDAGAKVITGLTFKVEIGAVQDTADFKLGYLAKYGKITTKKIQRWHNSLYVWSFCYIS